jgi:hypothetical protein
MHKVYRHKFDAQIFLILIIRYQFAVVGCGPKNDRSLLLVWFKFPIDIDGRWNKTVL